MTEAMLRAMYLAAVALAFGTVAVLTLASGDAARLMCLAFKC